MSAITNGFDIVGDIHGQYAMLVTLLDILGYSKIDRYHWCAPEGRMLICLGDLIDRGPDSLEVVLTIKSMVETGNALCVMGNHEFNAICWTIPSLSQPFGYLRSHTPAHRRLHSSFLEQVVENSRLHHEIIDWFKTLPLWLEIDGIHCVHACWDEREMAKIQGMVTPKGVATSNRFFHIASRMDSEIYHLAIGPEIILPNGQFFHDKDGTRRNDCRIRWWLNTPNPTWRELLLLDDESARELPAGPVPHDLYYLCPVTCPTFIGHYWLAPVHAPTPITPNLACLDYSAGKNGPLVAYRWNTNDSELRATQYALALPVF